MTVVLLHPTGGHPGVQYARERLLGDAPEAFAASWRALADQDAAAGLPSLRVPVTVLHAESDVTGSAAAKAAMVARMPHARLAAVPGPHMVQLENPAAFQQAVIGHLDWTGE
jgi:3-oxoadipate enol-lactonase